MLTHVTPLRPPLPTTHSPYLLMLSLTYGHRLNACKMSIYLHLTKIRAQQITHSEKLYSQLMLPHSLAKIPRFGPEELNVSLCVKQKL